MTVAKCTGLFGDGRCVNTTFHAGAEGEREGRTDKVTLAGSGVRGYGR